MKKAPFRRRMEFRSDSPVKAQTTVEFSFIVAIMLVLILSMCDYAQFYFYRQAMFHALREGGRFCVTGDVMRINNNVTNNPLPRNNPSSTQYMSRMESIKIKITNSCLLPIPRANVTITCWPLTSAESSATNGPGDPSQKVKIRITKPITFISPVGAMMFISGPRHGTGYTVAVESIFYTEPYKYKWTNMYSDDL
jgi:hypothetical protein